MKQKDRLVFCHDGSRWEQFWDVALTCLKQLERQYSKALCLVDCGAGCLKTDRAFSYFKSQTSVVSILDSPDVVFKRLNSSRPNGYWSTRSPSEYVQEEYSHRRKQFYDAAHHKLDVTGLNEEQAASQFIHFVGKLESNWTQPNESLMRRA
jgi:shikimate kinase